MARSTNSDAFKIQKKLLTVTGFWPYRKPTLLYKTYGVINYVSAVILTVSLIFGIFVLEGVDQRIQCCILFFGEFNGCVKLAIFRFKTPTFLDLLDFLHSPHFTYYNEKFDPHLKRTIQLSIFTVKLFLCSCFGSVIFLISETLFDFRRKRQTPLPFPLDLQQQPMVVYLFVFVFQFYTIFTTATTVIGFDNLPTSMMGLCSGYFKILGETIKRITDLYIMENRNSLKEMLTSYGNFDQVVNDELYKCVEHHLAIIKFTDAVENIFTYTFLCQFLSSAAAICLAIFRLQTATPGSLAFIVAISFLATLMFEITLYCAYGDEVTIQSSQIRDACYITEWVNCGPSVRKTLFIIMERSKRPVYFTAGKFVNLSLESLVRITRSAFSYAAVLRQLLNK